jgi:Mce-associated membrane protein
MTDETTHVPEPEDDGQPPVAAERYGSPETGWPSSPAATAAGAEEPVEASDEPELDAWLDAQETGWAAQEPAEHAPSAPEPTEAPAAEPAAEAGPEQVEVPVEEPAPAEEPVAAAEIEELPTPEQPEQPADEPAEPPTVDEAEPAVETEVEPDEQPQPVAEPAVEPELEPPAAVEEHGADHAAAEVAGAALFSTVPADVVQAEPAPVPVALDEPEPAAQAPEAGEPAVPEPRTATALVAALVVLVLLLAGLTAFLAQRSVSTRAGGSVEDARHDGLQAARNAARVVFSYDYRHLDKDFAAGKALTTGAFEDQYATTTPKLVEVAKTYQAVVAADVSDAAVISATAGKVVVLVFVNQQSSSTLAAAPKITQSRVTMTMQHRAGRWLVSDVHAF